MAKERGASWERYGRRFIVRLSLKQEEQRALLEEYDRRTALLGSEDKDFLVACLVAGFRVLTDRVRVMDVRAEQSIMTPDPVALSANESNNTIEQQKSSVLSADSHPSPSTPLQVAPVATVPDAPSRNARHVLGGLMRHE